MAVVLSNLSGTGRVPSRPVFHETLTVTFDASYPTGGEVLGLAAAIGDGKSVVAIIPLGIASNGNVPVADIANDKLKMFVFSTGVEVADAVDLTGVTAEILVISE